MAMTPAERQRASRARRAAKRDSVTRRDKRDSVTGVTAGADSPKQAKAGVARRHEGLRVRSKGRRIGKDCGGLPIASQEQFEEAATRYGNGEHWNDIGRDMKITWGMFSRRGQAEGNVERYLACQCDNKLATIKRIGENAERCAFDGRKIRRVVEKVVTADGQEIVQSVKETEDIESDPSMARIALEVAAPEIHGKLAGAKQAQAQQQAVQVTIVMSNKRRDVDEMPEIDVSSNMSEKSTAPEPLQDTTGDESR